jgi:hypothetical protein
MFSKAWASSATFHASRPAPKPLRVASKNPAHFGRVTDHDYLRNQTSKSGHNRVILPVTEGKYNRVARIKGCGAVLLEQNPFIGDLHYFGGSKAAHVVFIQNPEKGRSYIALFVSPQPPLAFVS